MLLQGNRILEGEQFPEIPVFPSRPFVLGGQTAWGLPIPVQQIEELASLEDLVMRRMTDADTAFILADGDVQDPVQRVLNTPVTMHCLWQAFVLCRQAGDEVADLCGRTVLQAPFRLDHDHAAEARPGRDRHTAGNPGRRSPSNVGSRCGRGPCPPSR